MVGQRTLDPPAKVRILLPQPEMVMLLPNLKKRESPSVPYIAIHRATITPPNEPLVVSEGDIRLTLTPGPISFSYSVPMKSFVNGTARMTLGTRHIDLPSGSYIEIEMLTESFTDSEREHVALAIAEAASLITLQYPYLLDEKLFEGVVNSPNTAVMWAEGPMTLTASPSITPETVARTLQNDFSKV